MAAVDVSVVCFVVTWHVDVGSVVRSVLVTVGNVTIRWLVDGLDELSVVVAVDVSVVCFVVTWHCGVGSVVRSVLVIVGVVVCTFVDELGTKQIGVVKAFVVLDDLSCELDRDGRVAIRGAVDAEDWALDVLEQLSVFATSNSWLCSLSLLRLSWLCSLSLLLPASAAFTDRKIHLFAHPLACRVSDG